MSSHCNILCLGTNECSPDIYLLDNIQLVKIFIFLIRICDIVITRFENQVKKNV